MRELIYVEPKRLEWRERAAPRLDSEQAALVRPVAVARCDLDQPMASGRYPVKGPFALGHEFVAEVVEVGSEVRGVALGDRVCVAFQIGCGRCARCVSGRANGCERVPFGAAFGLAPLSGHDFGGALSDLVLVPFADAMLVRLPKHVPAWMAAGAGDNLADAYRCVAPGLAECPGASVLIVGGGAVSVGLYAALMARALGASEVVYVDRDRERLALAERLGARVFDAEPSAAPALGRHPITVDASADPAWLRLALAATDVDGLCTSVGIYLEDVPLPLRAMFTRGIRFVTGRVQSRSLLPEVLARVADGTFDVGAVAPRRTSWDEALEAWAAPATKLIVERS